MSLKRSDSRLVKRTVLLFALFVLFLAHLATAQDALQFEWHGKEDGLPGTQVLDVVQDSSRAVWIGTTDGLYRWNGLDIDAYRKIPGDSSSIAHNYVSRLKIIRNHYLLVGTLDGLSICDLRTRHWRSIKVVDFMQGNFIRDIVALPDGQVMISFQSAGVVRLDLNTYNYTLLPLASIHPQLKYIIGISPQDDKHCWVSGFGGLVLISNDFKEKYFFTAVPPENRTPFDNQLVSIQADPKNPDQVWCGSWGGGLKRFTLSSKKWETIWIEDSTLPRNLHNIVHAITPVKEDRFYLNTSAGALAFDTRQSSVQALSFQGPEGNEIRYFHRLSKTENGSFFICSGNIWGYSGANKKVRLHAYKRGVFNINLTPIDINKNDTVLLGSMYSKRTLYEYLLSKSMAIDSLTLPMLDKEIREIITCIPYGKKYIFSTSKDCYEVSLSDQTIRALPILNKASNARFSYVTNMTMPRNDTLLIQDGQGFFYRAVLEKQYKQTVLRILNQVGKNKFFHTVDNKDGSFLLTGDSIYKYTIRNNNIEVVYAYKKTEQGLLQYDFLADRIGNLWVCFDQNGILKLTPSQKGYSASYFLPRQNYPATYFDLEEDGQGGIFATSYQGLFHFSSSLTPALCSSGYKDDAFSEHTNLFRTGNKTWAYNNLHFYHLETFPENSVRSEVVLEFRKISMGGAAPIFVLPGTRLSLNKSNNSFLFELAAINPFEAVDYTYRYRLVGLNENWQECSNLRTGSFTQVPPGDYILEAQALDPDNGSVVGHTSLPIYVKPEWHQLLWVRVLLISLALALLVWLAIYISTKRLELQLAEAKKQRELERMRQTISKDIHDELGSSITRITLSTELLLRQQPTSIDTKEQLKRIGNLSKDLGKSLGEIVWAVNPEQDELEHFILFTRQYLSDLSEDTGYKIKLQVTEDDHRFRITPQAQRNLFLIIKEAVNNAIKYANPPQIEVRLDWNRPANTFQLRISDDGVGFNLNELRPFSNGITNFKSRAAELELTFSMHSEMGKGTSITLSGTMNKIEQTSY